MNLGSIEEKFEIVAITALILLVFFAATLRWFGIDVSWSIDVAQLLFAWICFIGADLAMRQKRHMGVDMLVKKFPIPVQNGISLFNSILMIAFLMLVLIFGVRLCIENGQRNFNTIPISYSLVTASAPTGAALMIITLMRRVKEYIMNFVKHDYTSIIKTQDNGGEVL